MAEMRVLIIDDEADVCTFFRRLLAGKGYTVVTATNEADAVRALEGNSFTVAMVDLKLPDTDGLTLLQMIKARQPACEVIIMTGYSTIKTAVMAMQLGAYEYLEKPFDNITEIETFVARAANHALQSRHGGAAGEEWSEAASAVGLHVGSSPGMRRMVSLAYRIAGKDINVLIQGKTGTGKEVLSRFIHAASGRTDYPFIPLNCGAMPENLLESELFGHEKGSFTGAHQTRRGIFELADHGTLLLDEIGDASPQIQVKLLRVLETGEFMRVGGSKPIKTDVRIIAATNVDLEEAIREKTFREDLYYRLNVVRLDIPPLRSRADDIPLLAEQAVRQINPKLRISQGAMRLLQNYGWPGNVRELINIIRRAAAICSGDTIMPDHLGSTFSAAPADGGAALPVLQASPEVQGPFLSLEAFCDHYSRTAVLEKLEREDFDRLLASLSRLENSLVSAMRDRGLGAQRSRGLKDTEEETIRKTLDRYQWNITETARVLGIGRNTLYRKIKEYNLANH